MNTNTNTNICKRSLHSLVRNCVIAHRSRLQCNWDCNDMRYWGGQWLLLHLSKIGTLLVNLFFRKERFDFPRLCGKEPFSAGMLALSRPMHINANLIGERHPQQLTMWWNNAFSFWFEYNVCPSSRPRLLAQKHLV